MMLLAPLAVLPASWGVRLPQAKNALMILLCLALVVWLVRSWWVRAFLILAGVSYAASTMKVWGFAGLMALLGWALVYDQAGRLSEASWTKLRVAIAIAALVQVAWLGVQALDADPLFRRVSTMTGQPEAGPIPLVGWFGNRTDLAIFLGLSLPALAMLPRWWGPALAGGTALVILVVLKSTSGFVPVAIVAGWLGWRWSRRQPVALRRSLMVGLGVVFLAVAGLFFVVLDPPFGQPTAQTAWAYKPTVWVTSLNLALMQPWTGWGPNALGYRVHIILGDRDEYAFAFNEWVQGALEFGFPTVLLAAGYVGFVLARMRRRPDLAELRPAFVSIVLLTMFSIPFRVGPAALLVAVWLGQLEGRLSAHG